MSRKHNVAKQGARSRYPDRLRRRGDTPTSARMPFIDRRGRQHDTLDAMLRGDRVVDQQDGER